MRPHETVADRLTLRQQSGRRPWCCSVTRVLFAELGEQIGAGCMTMPTASSQPVGIQGRPGRAPPERINSQSRDVPSYHLVPGTLVAVQLCTHYAKRFHARVDKLF